MRQVGHFIGGKEVASIVDHFSRILRRLRLPALPHHRAHRLLARRCVCGTGTQAPAPAGVSAPAQEVRALPASTTALSSSGIGVTYDETTGCFHVSHSGWELPDASTLLNTRITPTPPLRDTQRRLTLGVARTLVATVASERAAELNRVGLRQALERAALTQRSFELGASNQLDVVRVSQDVAVARESLVSGDERCQMRASTVPVRRPAELDGVDAVLQPLWFRPGVRMSRYFAETYSADDGSPVPPPT